MINIVDTKRYIGLLSCWQNNFDSSVTFSFFSSGLFCSFLCHRYASHACRNACLSSLGRGRRHSAIACCRSINQAPTAESEGASHFSNQAPTVNSKKASHFCIHCHLGLRLLFYLWVHRCGTTTITPPLKIFHTGASIVLFTTSSIIGGFTLIQLGREITTPTARRSYGGWVARTLAVSVISSPCPMEHGDGAMRVGAVVRSSQGVAYILIAESLS